MKARAYVLHALSPLHAGTGQAAGIVDLPIARMRATDIPYVPGSSIKGVLRDTHRETMKPDEWRAVFGPDTEAAADHAGALVVTDARLFALPVRSFRGTFAWVTSPLLLALARRDLDPADELPLPSINGRRAVVPEGSANTVSVDRRDYVYLEDLDLEADEADTVLGAWIERFGAVFGADREMFVRRFVVVDNETMTFLWETATQVDARIRISSETRTVAKGALWLEESLPAETLLLGVLFVDRSRRSGAELDPAEVLDRAFGGNGILQFGGKATVGRGRCRLVPLDAEARG